MATSGYTTIGANTDPTGTGNNVNWPGAMITMTETGTITKITAYVANTVSSNTPKCVLYGGSAGARGSSILGSTNTATVTTSFGLVDFTFPSAFPAVATTYWLEFDGDGGNGPGGNVGQIKYDTGGPTNTSYLLSDVGSPQYDTKKYTVYATYTPTGSPTGFTIALV